MKHCLGFFLGDILIYGIRGKERFLMHNLSQVNIKTYASNGIFFIRCCHIWQKNK